MLAYAATILMVAAILSYGIANTITQKEKRTTRRLTRIILFFMKR